MDFLNFTCWAARRSSRITARNAVTNQPLWARRQSGADVPSAMRDMDRSNFPSDSRLNGLVSDAISMPDWAKQDSGTDRVCQPNPFAADNTAVKFMPFAGPDVGAIAADRFALPTPISSTRRSISNAIAPLVSRLKSAGTLLWMVTDAWPSPLQIKRRESSCALRSMASERSQLLAVETVPVSTGDDTPPSPTFHYYDPFDFTHQGATWVDPSTPMGREFEIGKDVDALVQDVKKIREYIKRTGKTPFMGEFGAYEKILVEQREVYQRTVRTAFDNVGIGMCAWGHSNTFLLWDQKTGQWVPGMRAAMGLPE